MEGATLSRTDCSAGSKAPWESYVRQHQGEVWRYLRTLGCDAASADDLTQETFVRVLAKPHTERLGAAFLRHVARGLFVDEQRSSRRRAAAWAAAVDATWNEDTNDGETWLDALRACRRQLTGRAGAAVELFYDRGLSRADTAAALGLRTNGLKTLLQRVRGALRECITTRLRGKESP